MCPCCGRGAADIHSYTHAYSLYTHANIHYTQYNEYMCGDSYTHGCSVAVCVLQCVLQCVAVCCRCVGCRVLGSEFRIKKLDF